MNLAEQELLEKWRYLPPEQQREILDFTEFLVQKMRQRSGEIVVVQQLVQQEQRGNRSQILGERLRELRNKIVASGERLLTAEEIEQEIADGRNRLGDLVE